MTGTSASFIFPDWPAPKSVKAVCTTRMGGVSAPPYDAFNFADHVGDSVGSVQENRRRLGQQLGLPAEPVWLQQVHGVQVIDAKHAVDNKADGSFCASAAVVCVVLTADCLPVLLCDRDAGVVAALHAGWRGLAAGIIESGVTAMGLPGDSLMAWLGPAIGPQAFVVGDEVRDVFIQASPLSRHAFKAVNKSADPIGVWLVDLYALARQRLNALGVEAVYGGDDCSYTDARKFYSYRRDKTCGRMASLIWIEP
ncbi:MAG TPA: peptidoglycan editing factor PgeF [Acidiferrobacteraceae bacterium]|nr:peptidoglycan editing factor PgeF [Acidiferrobacteraceae bacterium]